MAQSAEKLWRDAKSLRKVIREKADLAGASTTEEAPLIEHFDKLGDLLARYRMSCVSTIFTDFKFASEEQVDDALWQSHVCVIRAYRKVKDRLNGGKLAVTRNKVTKHYNEFLKVSQGFYSGYLQRLSSRYHTLPELQRALRGAALKEIVLPASDHVDAAAAQIDKLVIASASRILVYLGDLARYRTLNRPEKDRKFDNSLAYYSLASDVDQNSGSPYNQMAVIYHEESRHLEIVYCLYRALLAEHPHPGAAKNLGLEFKNLLKATTPKGGKGHEALQFWFPRLHAHFEQGKAFSQHNELEKEVLGRFGMAVKAHNFGSGLLKMILINICAYEVAHKKIQADWTEEASQSCQFVLRLHVQMIDLVCGHIETELTGVLDNLRNGPDRGVSAPNAPENKFSQVLVEALPLLRVAMTWLCMYRSQIVDYHAHLVPYLPNMYRTLSRVLTGFIKLIELLQVQNAATTVNFLFTEDTMTLGLKPLNGPDLPPNCQLRVVSMTGEPKPRFDEDSNVVVKADDITYTRVLDITYRAFVLSSDAKFPLALSHDGSAVVYLEDEKPAPTIAGTNGSAVSNGPAVLTEPVAANPQVTTQQRRPSNRPDDMAAVLGLTRSPDGTQLQPVSKVPSPDRVTTPRETSVTSAQPSVSKAGTPVSRASRQAVKPGLAPIKPIRQPHNPPSGQVATNFRRHRQHPSNAKSTPTLMAQTSAETSTSIGMESRVYDNVKEFLEPDESQGTQRAADETSYGMHTATARDLLGSILGSSQAGTTGAASGLSEPLSAAWNNPAVPTAGAGWGNSTLGWYGSPSTGSQNAWPTTPASAGYGFNGATTNGNHGQGATRNLGAYPPPANLAPGTHWRQSSGDFRTAVQPRPWGQTEQSRQPDPPGSGANGSGGIKSLEDALAAQLGSIVQSRSPFSPAAQITTPLAGNHNTLPVPGSRASAEFAFSQGSSRPAVNSPWGVTNNPTGGYTYQAGSSASTVPPPPGFGRPGDSQRSIALTGAGFSQSQHSQPQLNGYSYGNQYYNGAFK
ncbi:hypothetical protein DL546_000859 [Coniochaeta pulveracea]|uniref:Nonsense-mediated mRNA decay factor n=1 Tax=Coniochaeta pulveracea TaxID=177199 RepID=A0A420Y6P8_9PEZI|nr:hypothetical protein DL546_000859 [Coniochaeta pulveracea]